MALISRIDPITGEKYYYDSTKGMKYPAWEPGSEQQSFQSQFPLPYTFDPLRPGIPQGAVEPPPPVTESYPFNPERPGIPIGAVEPVNPVTPYAFDPLRPGIPLGALETKRPVTPYTFDPLRPGIPQGAIETMPITSTLPYTFDPLRPGIPKGAIKPPPPVTDSLLREYNALVGLMRAQGKQFPITYEQYARGRAIGMTDFGTIATGADFEQAYRILSALTGQPPVTPPPDIPGTPPDWYPPVTPPPPPPPPPVTELYPFDPERPGIPLGVPEIPPPPPPVTPQPPVVPEPPVVDPYTQFFNQLLAMFGNIGQNVQGSNEPYTPSRSISELSQALQNTAMQDLNRPYGYTSEEQALMFQNAWNQFNQNQELDLRTLEGLFQKYGWNQGAAMGGQAQSSLEDYFGKRAIASTDLASQLTQQFANQRMTDRQAALQNAMGVNSQIYEQARGDFADQLSMLGFEELARNNEFTRGMTLASFQSEEAQRNFLNKQGISDRQTQDYFMQIAQQWQMDVGAQNLTDEGIKNFMNYLSGQEVKPADLLQASTWQDNFLADIQRTGISEWANQPDALLAMIPLLAQIFTGGDVTNITTGGTTVGAPNITTPSTDLGLGKLWEFLNSLTGGLLGKIGMPNIPGVDWSKIKLPDINLGNINWSNPLSWPKELVGSLMLPLGATFTIGNKTYGIGKDNTITEIAAGAGEGVDLNTPKEGDTYNDDQGQAWNYDESQGAWIPKEKYEPEPEPEAETGYYDDTGTWHPGNEIEPEKEVESEEEQVKEVAEVAAAGVPWWLKGIGKAITIYAIAKTAKDVLTSRFGKDIVNKNEQPYVVWSYLESGNIDYALNNLQAQDKFGQLLTLTAIKEGRLKTSEGPLDILNLDQAAIDRINSATGNLWNMASLNKINNIVSTWATEDSPPIEKVLFWKKQVGEAIDPRNNPYIVPSMSKDEYTENVKALYDSGNITYQQYVDASTLGKLTLFTPDKLTPFVETNPNLEVDLSSPEPEPEPVVSGKTWNDLDIEPFNSPVLNSIMPENIFDVMRLPQTYGSKRYRVTYLKDGKLTSLIINRDDWQKLKDYKDKYK